MVLKKVTIGFRMSDSIINGLYTEFPTIMKFDERGADHTMLIVDVTPAQESQIVPVLQSKLIVVEDVVGGVWPPV